MKQINKYIFEKLKIDKNTGKIKYKYHPKDDMELYNLLKKLIKERGYNADLNDVDVSKVTCMNGMFQSLPDNDKLEVDVSKWNMSKVTSADSMFHGCKKFNCDISEWDVSNLENMHAMFFRCMEFNQDLSNWDVHNVIDMDSAFEECESLNCNLENWDISKVENMHDTFRECFRMKNKPSWYEKNQ